jgi:predicted DNA-binding protein
MVKPPLRTKSIGFKVSEEEYGRLETAAQASGRTLGEWCREAILRGGSASDDPALAEIVGVRLLLVNVLRPLAAGEKLAPVTAMMRTATSRAKLRLRQTSPRPAPLQLPHPIPMIS